MKKYILLEVILFAWLCVGIAVRSSPSADGWVSIFDGKTLNGWKAAENPSTFSVQDGAIVVFGPRAHLFYDGPVNNHMFRNFEWKAQVKTMPGANSGMFIHTTYQDTGWPSKGYEIQVNQTHTDWRKTGSVYALQDVKETFVKDDEWYTEQISVQGKKVTIRINDKIINEYMEPDSISRGTSGKKLSMGTIALQGHDPKSKVLFKDIMVRVLPD
ncbi:3-keto-disaccharide hydrolase [Spirosoma arcticum]